MRSANTVLLLLVIFTTLSCDHLNPKFGDEKNSECGEVPVGVTIDKGQLDMAGAKFGDFSLANLNIKFTPEFQRIISDAATNALVLDYISCKVIEHASVRRDPELVDYFTNLTYFLSSKPTGEEQTKWRQANPFPGKKGKQELSGQESIGLDGMKIYFECEYKHFVKRIPPEGGLQGVLFFPKSPTVGSSAYVADLGPPGAVNIFSDPEKNGGRGFVCQITNYGNDPVDRIAITFELRFKEAISNPGQAVTGGATKYAIPWTSLIKKVVPRLDGTVVFYLINYSEYFLEVSWPQFADLRRLGEFESRRVQLSGPFDLPGVMFIRPIKYPLLPAN